jgi:hypothetical protein
VGENTDLEPEDPAVLEPAGTEQNTAARRGAADELTRISEEYELYGDPPSPEEAVAAVKAIRADLAAMAQHFCPFCGNVMPCRSHQSGGPA